LKITNPRAYSVCFAGDPAIFDHVIEALGGAGPEHQISLSCKTAAR